MKQLFFLLLLLVFVNINWLNAQPTHIPTQLQQRDSILTANKLIVVNGLADTLEVAELRKGKKHGKQVLFSPNGIKKQESTYRKGALDGIQNTYNPAGQLTKFFTFKRGEKVGPYQLYHPNGILAETGTLENGLNVDEKRIYQNSGRLISVENFTIINNPANQDAKQPASDEGQLKSIPKKISVLHGEAIYYYFDEKIREISQFHHGKKDGRSKTFYQNKTNSLASNVMYKKGLEHGEFAYYSANEQPQRNGVFYKTIEVGDTILKNVYDGKIEYFQENGELHRVERWENFKKNGIQESYTFRKGHLSQRSNFKDDLLEGKSETFDSEGNLTSQVFYEIVEKDGERVSQKTGTSKNWENGQLTQVINYKNGEIDGVLRTYYPNGQLEKEIFYKDGELSGPYKYFYENGILKKELNKKKVNGRIENIGWSSFYDEAGNIETKYFKAENGKKLITYKFEKGNKVEFTISNLFSLKYGINHQLASIEFASLVSRPFLNFHYFSNQQLKQIDFGTSNFSKLSALVNNEAEVIHLFNHFENSIEDEATKIIAQEIVNQHNSNWLEEELVHTDFPEGKYQWKYADGSPFFEVELKEHLPHGKTIIYNPIKNDTLFYENLQSPKMQVRKMVDGTLLSRMYYHENGQLKESIKNFQNGKLSSFTTYDSLGNTTYSEKYYENNNLKRIEYPTKREYINFRETGDTLSYGLNSTETDSLLILRDFHEGNRIWKDKRRDLKDGSAVEKIYFENGQLRFYMEEKDYKKDGVYKAFDADGNLLQQGSYKAGKRHGEWIDFSEGKQEISYFEEGVFQEPEVTDCRCFNTSLPQEEVKFANSLNYLFNYENVKAYLPSTITPIEDFNYTSIYYTNFIPNQGRGVGSTRFKLMFYGDFQFYYGAENHLKLDLIPCKTTGHISNIDANLSYDYENKILLSSALSTDKIAVTLENNPLKNSSDQSEFKAYFETDYIRFNETGIQTIQFLNNENNCFPSANINDVLEVNIENANLIINPKSLFFNRNFPLLRKESDRFTGLQISEASVRFRLNSSVFEASCEQILAGPNYVAGKLLMEGKLTNENEFKPKQSEQIFRLSELEELLQKNGFYRIKIEVFNEYLSIEFYAE